MIKERDKESLDFVLLGNVSCIVLLSLLPYIKQKGQQTQKQLKYMFLLLNVIH